MCNDYGCLTQFDKVIREELLGQKSKHLSMSDLKEVHEK